MRLKAQIVNYADDCVICCRGTAEQASLDLSQYWAGRRSLSILTWPFPLALVGCALRFTPLRAHPARNSIPYLTWFHTPSQIYSRPVYRQIPCLIQKGHCRAWRTKDRSVSGVGRYIQFIRAVTPLPQILGHGETEPVGSHVESVEIKPPGISNM